MTIPGRVSGFENGRFIVRRGDVVESYHPAYYRPSHEEGRVEIGPIQTAGVGKATEAAAG